MRLPPSATRQLRAMASLASPGVATHQRVLPQSAARAAVFSRRRKLPAKTSTDRRNDATTSTTLPTSSSVVAAASTSDNSSSSSKTTKPVSIRLPIGPGDQADQAAAACVAAWREGRSDSSSGAPNPLSSRLLVTLSLPLVGATDLDDWPGGIRQQFKAAKPMVERMLEAIRKQAGEDDDGGPFFREAPRPTLWDDADAVCCYDSPKLACVVFPTPETLKRLDTLAASKDKVSGGGGGLTIIVNPQWSLAKGTQNIISDFGIGPWRAANEKKAASFEPAFCLKSVRIRGDEARVWYSRAAELDFKEGRRSIVVEGEGKGEGEAAAAAAAAATTTPPEMEPRGPWNVFLVTAAGSMKSSSRLISSGDSEPSYSELEEILKNKGNVATKGWLERAQSEARFLKDSL